MPKFVRDAAAFRIVDFLGEDPGIAFSKDEIRKNARVGKAEFNSVWRELAALRAIKGKRSYELSKQNPPAKALWNVLATCGRIAG